MDWGGSELFSQYPFKDYQFDVMSRKRRANDA